MKKAYLALDVRHDAALRAPSLEGSLLPLQCGVRNEELEVNSAPLEQDVVTAGVISRCVGVVKWEAVGCNLDGECDAKSFEALTLFGCGAQGYACV